MLYLGIDQHARQITISLRDENGDVLMARQVSTRPKKIHEFFMKLTRERLQKDGRKDRFLFHQLVASETRHQTTL